MHIVCMTHSFDAFARERGLTNEQIAEAIERDRSLVSKFRRGKAVPSLKASAAIQDHFGFPMRDWLPEAHP